LNLRLDQFLAIFVSEVPVDNGDDPA